MLFRRGSGFEALTAWLTSRAKRADHFVVLEEALLSGRFANYALRRLTAFGLARIAAIVIHLVELMWLFEIFSAKPFVASIALQNVTLVVDALFWGALESLRHRLRSLGKTSESAALVTRFLTLASWVALAAVILPIGLFVFGKHEHLMLHAYALACGVRLAADVVLRTYYSGVFAFSRVHRPVWAALLPPFVVMGVTIAGWESLGGWSFVTALFVSIVLSRGLLYVFTRRAYARFRVPRPRWRLFSRGLTKVVDWRVILAGIANLSTRLGGVVLLAALIPTMRTDDGVEGEAVIEPFAFSLHLAAPFLLAASQWAFVFYHDWKRLERAETARLASLLERKLVTAAVLVGVVCTAFASGLVLVFVPLSRSWPTLLSLLVATVGMSIWTSLQLRRFAHGEHFRQAISAGAIVIVVGASLSSEELGVVAFYFALATGPWAAIAIAFVLDRLMRRDVHGLLGSAAAFALAASRAKGPLVLWEAQVDKRATAIAERIAARLGSSGAVIRTKTRVVWFERVAPTPTSRADWLALGAGRLRSLTRTEMQPGDAHRMLTAEGSFTAPHPDHDDERLAQKHAELFPQGFVLRLDAPPPARYLALPAATRQAIWRDALRSHAGARGGRSGWVVSCQSRGGAPEVIFATPRPVSAEESADWRRAIARADWRVGVPDEPRS